MTTATGEALRFLEYTSRYATNKTSDALRAMATVIEVVYKIASSIPALDAVIDHATMDGRVSNLATLLEDTKSGYAAAIGVPTGAVKQVQNVRVLCVGFIQWMGGTPIGEVVFKFEKRAVQIGTACRLVIADACNWFSKICDGVKIFQKWEIINWKTPNIGRWKSGALCTFFFSNMWDLGANIFVRDEAVVRKEVGCHKPETEGFFDRFMISDGLSLTSFAVNVFVNGAIVFKFALTNVVSLTAGVAIVITHFGSFIIRTYAEDAVKNAGKAPTDV